MNDAPLRRTAEGTVIELKVQPKASRTRIGPVNDGRLKIAVTDPPDKDKANRAVMRALAKELSVAPSRLEIVSGHTSRKKSVLLREITETQARDWLKTLTKDKKE